jgi:hypothetical protein
MDNVKITSSNPGKQIRASCNNAKGTAISASPLCLAYQVDDSLFSAAAAVICKL